MMNPTTSPAARLSAARGEERPFGGSATAERLMSGSGPAASPFNSAISLATEIVPPAAVGADPVVPCASRPAISWLTAARKRVSRTDRAVVANALASRAAASAEPDLAEIATTLVLDNGWTLTFPRID